MRQKKKKRCVPKISFSLRLEREILMVSQYITTILIFTLHPSRVILSLIGVVRAHSCIAHTCESALLVPFSYNRGSTYSFARRRERKRQGEREKEQERNYPKSIPDMREIQVPKANPVLLYNSSTHDIPVHSIIWKLSILTHPRILPPHHPQMQLDRDIHTVWFLFDISCSTTCL